MKLINIHYGKQSAQRVIYDKNKDKAWKHPDDLLVLTIDGSDQSKTCLPIAPPELRSSREWSSPDKLVVHLVGVLTHGYSMHPKVFSVLKDYPHDANMTASALFDVILSISAEKKLPVKLLLQMDNTSRENKNHTIFAFCSWLVFIDAFEEVEMNFLMVGHTHTDIDQLFSQISK